MDTNKQLLQIFEKYNETFAKAFDKQLEDESILVKIQDDKSGRLLHQLVTDSIQNWHLEPIAESGGLTAADIMDRIDTLDGAFDLAVHAALYCDDEFPEAIKDKLSSFGQPLTDRLVSHILQSDFNLSMESLDEDEGRLQVSAQALRLLADWKQSAYLPAITEKFAEAPTPNEMIADAVRIYLSSIGNEAIPRLLDMIGGKLKTAGDLDGAGEYLLMALTEIGRNDRQDEIFQLLRSAFKTMDNKVIGAICIGDYGDGRGVAILKGWLDRHPEADDRQTIGEILSSIKRLGGDIRDVQHRFKPGRGL